MMSEAAGAPHRHQGRMAPGELYPRVGFIATNPSRPAERMVVFYHQRGTVEQWIKEGKERDQLEAAIVPLVPGQRRSPPAAQAGLQPRQRPARVGAAGDSRAPVAYDAAREVREDRRQGCAARSRHDLPDGRGRRAEVAVPGDPAAHRRAATSTGAIMTGCGDLDTTMAGGGRAMSSARGSCPTRRENRCAGSSMRHRSGDCVRNKRQNY